MKPFALASLIALAALLAAALPAQLAVAAKPFKVASTLDGKTVLPRHLRRLAMPTLASTQIDKVEFRIDGKLRWVEEDAP
jgi:hypothetical protein